MNTVRMSSRGEPTQVKQSAGKKWRTAYGLIRYFSKSSCLPSKRLPIHVLRFNPIRIAEWLNELLPADSAERGENRRALGQRVGIPQYRVSQYLALLNFPVDLRTRLKQTDWVAEGHLRPFTRMKSAAMRAAVGRLLGSGAMAKAG